MTDDNLPCWVYRSPRIQEMYLYLAHEDGFATLERELQVGPAMRSVEVTLVRLAT